VVLGVGKSFERTQLPAEQTLKHLTRIHGKHSYPVTEERGMVSQAGGFLETVPHLHSPCEKSIIERTIQIH